MIRIFETSKETKSKWRLASQSRFFFVMFDFSSVSDQSIFLQDALIEKVSFKTRQVHNNGENVYEGHSDLNHFADYLEHMTGGKLGKDFILDMVKHLFAEQDACRSATIKGAFSFAFHNTEFGKMPTLHLGEINRNDAMKPFEDIIELAWSGIRNDGEFSGVIPIS